MKNNKEYSPADSYFIKGYNRAIKEFNDKNLVIIEGKLYLLTDYQYNKMIRIRESDESDRNNHYMALEYAEKVGTFLRDAKQVYNY
jgi:hypothetical protein